MTDNDSAADKSIVNELNFGAKTAKRVGWEAWEFSIESPHLVRVTNASYGIEKDDHSYLVGVEDRDGHVVPAECECPADKYNEEYDCKHKVALATVAGPVVLQAAVDCPTPAVNTERTPTYTLKEQIRTDGGVITEQKTEDISRVYAEKPDECDCAKLSDDFPCWSCVRDGKRDLPK